jgi:hypothetical protein
MNKSFALFVVFHLAFLASGQLANRTAFAVRAEKAPVLDGLLNDEAWATAKVTDQFWGLQPYPGRLQTHNTEVRVVYTNEALYVGIYAYDPAPDSILQQLTGRDGDGNSDYVGVALNCYKDGVTGYMFAVSPRGEQYDARQSANGEDASWNAVWDCKTKIVKDGWIAEFKIPYAALRFPNLPEQHWHVNFVREIRRSRLQANWSFVDPAGAGFLAQMGHLKGISGIVPPKRVFFYPYISTYSKKEQSGSNQFAYSGGMDLKIGLNEAYTLDATLIPDFGQTISDQLILNLTPYEIQFQDNRQFFNEGLELFSRGGVFYSRRVGGTPLFAYDVSAKIDSNEQVLSNPMQTQLINATKISGRNSKGLAVAFFNAITNETSAEVENTTSHSTRKIITNPLTNYNVFVIDQNLPNKSQISLTNTNVMRKGSIYDANVTALQTRLLNKANSFALTASGALSSKNGMDFFGNTPEDKLGHRYSIDLSKVSGNFTFSANHYTESNTYDPNDLGYLQANNEQVNSGTVGYSIYKPFWKLNKAWTNFSYARSNLYQPRTFTSNFVEGEFTAITNKFLYINLNYDAAPTRGYDFFEPRVDGMKFQTYKYFRGGAYISSDYRKRLAIDAGTGYGVYENAGRYVLNWRISPRFRLNDKWMFTYVYSRQQHFNDLGYATFNEGAPVFGRRDAISHTNVLTVAFAFNPVNSMNMRFRHYWGYSRYHEFFGLKEDGTLGSTAYTGANSETNDFSAANRDFNSLTVDLFYKWIFRPGSEMIFAWKYAIIHEDNQIQANLISDFNQTTQMPFSNSVSIRMIYFLDYRMLSKNKGEGVYKYQ